MARMNPPVRETIRRREIADIDLPAVAEFLSKGFTLRPAGFWLRGLQKQANRARPENTPKYGYALFNGDNIVGAILMFSAIVNTESGPVQRCNLSSWFVDPKYRNFGSLLITSALKNKDVTYFNMSPAPHTWQTVEAQGFTAYCQGEMVALPVLAARQRDVVIERIDETSRSSDDYDSDLLTQHAKLGCLSVIVHHDGRRYPFVFVRQKIKRLIPCVRLVYCRDVESFARFAGNLGRYLLRYGGFLTLLDANGPVPGLVGWYSESKGRKYARGPHAPRLGDLAFSEAVYFR